MNIKEFLLKTAALVRPREIIDHHGNRMLPDAPEVQALLERLGYANTEELEHGEIGDDELADALEELADDEFAIAELPMSALCEVYSEWFYGETVAAYVDAAELDQLEALDGLIESARDLV